MAENAENIDPNLSDAGAAAAGDELTAEQAEMADALAESIGFEAGENINLAAIQDVPIELSVVLGEKKIKVEDLLKMGNGAVIELNRKVGENVEVFVNERCVAKGEIVIVDEKIGITMTEIIKNDKE